MNNNAASLLAAASVLAFGCSATPAHAAYIYTDTISGTFDSGIDAEGFFGTTGADLTGVPYSFTIYYRARDMDFLEGMNGDFYVSHTWGSGFIGDLELPFGRDFGTHINSYEDDTFKWSFVAPKWDVFASGYVNGCCGDWWDDQQTNVSFPGGWAQDLYSDHVRGGVSALPAVPEPATWGMMLLGFYAIGSMVRRSRRTKVTVSYA